MAEEVRGEYVWQGEYSVCWNSATGGVLADEQENLHRHFGSQKGRSQGVAFTWVRPAALDLGTLEGRSELGKLRAP